MTNRTPLDTLGVFDATFGLPEQVEAAAGVDLDQLALPDGDAIDQVCLVGMGDSGIAADLVAATAGPLSPVPVIVTKGYDLAAFVDQRTLVVAMSVTGDTPETLSAAAQAREAGAVVVAACQGGRLAELAGTWGQPMLRLPADIEVPRTAIGALAVPPILLLERLGLLDGATAQVAAAVDQLKRRRDRLTSPDSDAAVLARLIDRTMPLIYGGGAIGAVAVARWKAQCNQNAKVPAFANVVPDLCHHELSGWGQHGDVTRQVFTQILLRHDFEHPGVSAGFDLLEPLVDEVVGATARVRAKGDGPLAQLLDLILIGDVVSLELAAREGIDPGPVPVLDQLERALSDR